MGLASTRFPGLVLETWGKIQFNENDPNHNDHLRRIEDVLQVWEGSWQQFVPLHPKYCIFLETSSKIKLNEDDHNHYDHYQEPQKKNVSPKCPPNGAQRAPYVAEGHKLWPKATSPPQELE